MTPTENWPKPFLLAVHEQAVKEGCIFIEPITKADAESLKSRLYRIRRRSDKSMAAFIPPEYHLVMIGEWEEDHHATDGTGRLPVIYDKKPDGLSLPKIRTPTGDEIAAYVPKPRIEALPNGGTPELYIAPEDLTMKPDEIGGFVESMRRSAKERRS